MGSLDEKSLKEMVSSLEEEAELYGNKTAEEYLRALQKHLDTVTLMPFHSREDPNYDTNAGIAWVVSVPVIYFSSVVLVMFLLLVLFKHTETHNVQVNRDVDGDVVDAALRSSGGDGGGVRGTEISHGGQECALVVDCNGTSATANKAAAFLRGYVNAAGEVEGASRASGASKGSVRSLGVLTDPDCGATRRPHFNSFHPNPPPSAPSTLTRHGMTTFEVLARRRLSKSIDELRDEARAVSVAMPVEWSGLGAVGGRTSLEMNVTSGGPQLTMLGSDLAAPLEFPSGSNRRSNSVDSLDENVSRDSLRASMELHGESGGSGLRSDHLYGHAKRKEGSPSEEVQHDHSKLIEGYSVSSSSIESARINSRDFGNINLSFVNSDIDDSKSPTGSNTYSDILSLNKADGNRNYENVNCVVHKPPGLGIGHDNTQFSQSIPPTRVSEITAFGTDSTLSTTKATSTIGTTTNIVDSGATDIRFMGHANEWAGSQKARYPEGFAFSQSVASWSSASDIAGSSTHRSRSPIQRGRPLSLDMLTSWSEEIESQSQARSGMRHDIRKQVPRQLFATTPQVSRKQEIDFGSKSAPVRQGIGYPPHIDFKTFKISPEGSYQNARQREQFKCLPDYSSSNSQETPSYHQGSEVPNAKTVAKPSFQPPDKITVPSFQSHFEPPDKLKVSNYQNHEPRLHTNFENAYSQRRGTFIRSNNFDMDAEPQMGEQSQYARDISYIDRTNNVGQETAFIQARETNGTVGSDHSVWISPDTSGRQQVEIGHTESSADSTVDSMSSSIAPFHAKRLDGLRLPRTNYQLPNEHDHRRLDPQESEALNRASADDNGQPDLSGSLDPNPGSCNDSVEETSSAGFEIRDACSAAPGFYKDNDRDNTQRGQPHRAAVAPHPTSLGRRPPPAPVSRRHGSLLELAHNVFFSRSPHGPATTVGSLTQSPERGSARYLESLERSTTSAESVSDGVVHDRRVTAEQRLAEYGFIKSLTGGARATFVVNPSPGKFSQRTGQVPLDSANAHQREVMLDRQREVMLDRQREVMLDSSNFPCKEFMIDAARAHAGEEITDSVSGIDKQILSDTSYTTHGEVMLDSVDAQNEHTTSDFATSLRKDNPLDPKTVQNKKNALSYSSILNTHGMHKPHDTAMEQEVVELSHIPTYHRKITNCQGKTTQTQLKPLDHCLIDLDEGDQFMDTPGACESCNATEPRSENNYKTQDSCLTDTNNNSLDTEPNGSQVVIDELKSVCRPSVQTMRDRFQQRGDESRLN